MAVKSGLEVLSEQGFGLLKGKKVGLLTNATAVTRKLDSAIDLFLSARDFELVALFSLDHGLTGLVETGGDDFGTWKDSGRPIYNIARIPPTGYLLRGIDILVYDTMDGGARYFANIYNMAKLMKAGAALGIPYVVLDRPNPVNGLDLEGNLIEDAFRSNVGMFPILMRHAMTNGEIAQYFNAEFGLGAKLTVVKMEGWKRDMWWDDTSLPWILPSPNLPTLTSVSLYPGICLFEGVDASLGRGTTRPFEFIGAPWIDEVAFARELNSLGLEGVQFRPVVFTPNFSNRSHPSYVAQCQGVQIHVLDRNKMRSVMVALSIVATMRRMYPEHAGWYYREGRKDENYFDLLTGTDKVRKALEAGVAPKDIVASWAKDQADFKQKRAKYLLY